MRLRGLAAEEDAKVALAELCAAQLEAVASVKRAYYDLHFNERAEQILLDNRRLAEDFLRITRSRYETTNAGLQNVLQAEVVIRDLDRELVRVRQGVAAARADLAQQLHLSPEADLADLAKVAVADAPEQVDRLYRLAVVTRPELQGRLAAIARDARAVELARKRFYPNMSVGLSYMDMTRQNAVVARRPAACPTSACSSALTCRSTAEARMPEWPRPRPAPSPTPSSTRPNATRPTGRSRTCSPRFRLSEASSDTFKPASCPGPRRRWRRPPADTRRELVDFPTLITSWREVLQIELQIAQVESELGKALASLERAVGSRINESPPTEPDVPEVPPPPRRTDVPYSLRPPALPTPTQGPLRGPFGVQNRQVRKADLTSPESGQTSCDMVSGMLVCGARFC